MPLDIQPLSMQRRLGLIGVLAVLFVGSLGFAQYLVNRRLPIGDVRTSNNPVSSLVSRPSISNVRLNLDELGFTSVVTDGVQVPGLITDRVGQVDKQEREVQVIYGQPLHSIDPNVQAGFAVVCFGQFTGHPPTKTRIVPLPHRQWVEVSGPAEGNGFMILRIATVANRALIICYSGDGEKSDADIAMVNAICDTGVHINMESPATQRQ